jgi:ATP-dependent DNA helicase RecG
MLRRYIDRAIDKYATSLENELPAEIIARKKLLSKATALKATHFPSTITELELAKKTLIYEELFYLEVMVGKRVLERKKGSREWGVGSGEQRAESKEQGAKSDERKPRSETTLAIHSSPTPYSLLPTPLQQRLLERLPFSLTNGQLEAIAVINTDMATNTQHSMARLLQGDVGSGKTLVSFLAALQATESGGQAAIMAPTELLARQHAENAAR